MNKQTLFISPEPRYSLSEQGYCRCMVYRYDMGAWHKASDTKCVRFDEMMVENRNPHSRVRYIQVKESDYGSRGEHLPDHMTIDPLDFELSEEEKQKLWGRNEK